MKEFEDLKKECKDPRCKHYHHIALDINDLEVIVIHPAYCDKQENDKCPEIVKRSKNE